MGGGGCCLTRESMCSDISQRDLSHNYVCQRFPNSKHLVAIMKNIATCD